jgi:hypothetical protein
VNSTPTDLPPNLEALAERGRLLSVWDTRNNAFVRAGDRFMAIGHPLVAFVALTLTGRLCGAPTWLVYVLAGWSVGLFVVGIRRGVRFLRAYDAESDAQSAYAAATDGAP